MIKAVIFDWGETMTGPLASGMVSYYAKELRADKEELKTAIIEFKNEFQKGFITEEEFWGKICKKLGLELPNNGSLWIEGIKNSHVEIEEMFDLALGLRKKGYKTGILSNTEMPVVHDLFGGEYCGIKYKNLFDTMVFSCKEGIRKPEKEIYEITLERLGVQPHEAVFIDNKEDNVKGAQEVGIYAILFESPKQVKKELEGLSVLVGGD